MPRQSNRTVRVDVRISPDDLAVVKRAAEIQGRGVSEFMVDAAQQVAHKTIEEITIIRLSVEDQRLMTESILNPPEPNEALRRAFEAHKRLFVEPK
jgi:uncharacterized protein (DUF1778 family)